MSMAESKVSDIIKSLNELEGDLDSIDDKVAEMKKQFAVKAPNIVDTLLGKVTEMATAEAETIINTAKEEANIEAAKIEEAGQSKLSEIQSNIDANFDNAVKHVLSTVLKA